MESLDGVPLLVARQEPRCQPGASARRWAARSPRGLPRPSSRTSRVVLLRQSLGERLSESEEIAILSYRWVQPRRVRKKLLSRNTSSHLTKTEDYKRRMSEEV
ncbi:hypothetical protein C2845_PM03G33770 [Panicum miliaceum]|uniref:Uncharacterized protein n=1 Tax=Panicum miliaceum TaxID=4540 RepID=A0A3L6T7C5_PANMI|nr:hypothetical protein C2845_PM03G33770 [Panicum miliaceum]